MLLPLLLLMMPMQGAPVSVGKPIPPTGAVEYKSLQQPTLERQLLELEHARGKNTAPISTAIAGNDARLQRLAARTAGRLERPELAALLLPLLKSTNVGVRLETANALGQMQAKVDYAELLKEEKVPAVRGELYATIGRVMPMVEGAEQTLVAGLAARSADERLGAIRGLESLVRLNGRTRVVAATLDKMRATFALDRAEAPRELLLIALNAAILRDTAQRAATMPIFEAAMNDTSPQVRRIAVAGSRQWKADLHPSVRYQALRTANNCEHAEAAVSDADEGVALAAIDMVGDKKCATAGIEKMVTSGSTWRLQAHSLVALSKTAPAIARAQLPRFASHTTWQARVYAATAAKFLNDSATLAKLVKDVEPNVVVEAMLTPADAMNALNQNHSGLLRAAALKLKGSPALPGAVPKILAAFQRVSRNGFATTRDPRIALLDRLNEAADAPTAEKLRPYLSDVDPAVAKLVATIISSKTGKAVDPITTELLSVRLPTQETITSVRGATAKITMKGLGVITLELLTEDAPITVVTFADLATKGKFNGLTFHRIVPNFVIQGGSPGADEYDGITQQFMKEEVGLQSHLRGTLGISTRGHDTGDGQIFINLIDNFRLDHQYTVFARVISGLDIVDRIQEGDVMESVQIIRR